MKSLKILKSMELQYFKKLHNLHIILLFMKIINTCDEKLLNKVLYLNSLDVMHCPFVKVSILRLNPSIVQAKLNSINKILGYPLINQLIRQKKLKTTDLSTNRSNNQSEINPSTC